MRHALLNIKLQDRWSGERISYSLQKSRELFSAFSMNMPFLHKINTILDFLYARVVRFCANVLYRRIKAGGCMKQSLLVIMLISWSLGAMEFSINKDKKEKGDEIIELEEIREDSKKKRTVFFENELHDIEYQGGHYNPYYVDKEKYTNSFLSALPIFEGTDDEVISERMQQIKHILPQKYGQITEMLSCSYRTFKKSKRGLSDIDPKEVVNDINARIQYALLEIADETQKMTIKNREEDLAQQRRDRIRTTIISCVSLLFSIPAIVMAAINIHNAIH